MGNSPGPHLTNDDDEAACSSDQDEPIAAAAVLLPSLPPPPSTPAGPAVAAVPAAGEVKREVSVEMDFEDAEAASILSKVLPDMQKLTSTFADTRSSANSSSSGNSSGGAVQQQLKKEGGSGGKGKSSSSSRRGGAKGYEDLLDCLASLASSRAPLEPLHRRVSRMSMSVDDMDLMPSHRGGGREGGQFSSPFAPSSSLAAMAAARMEESEEEEGFEGGKEG